MYSKYRKQIYLRGGRSFLGVPKNASTHGIISEMNILLPQSRSQIRMIRQYHRLLNTISTNVCRKVFLWNKKLNEDNIVNTWYNEIKNIGDPGSIPATPPTFLTFLRVLANPCNPATRKLKLKNSRMNEGSLTDFVPSCLSMFNS